MRSVVNDGPEVRSKREVVALPGVVFGHSVARDSHQLALALGEARMLKSLIANLFWTGWGLWVRKSAPMFPLVEHEKPENLDGLIERALASQSQLSAMQQEARYVAEQFTWQKFRSSVAAALCEMTTTPWGARVASNAV